MSAAKFTIGRKFALLLAAFLALQALQFGVGLRYVRHVAEEAGHLSGAGKIRPLLLGDLARRSLAPGDERTARQKFLNMLAEYDRIHRQLVEEFGKKTGEPEYGELARLIVEAGDVWEREIRPLLLAVDPAQPAAARAALARYEAIGPVQAARFARLVALIEAHLRAEVREAVRTHSLLFALAMLLAVAAVILVYRQFTLPLRALAAASRAMTEGNYDRRLAVASRDEIGQLAETFNRMTNAVAEKTRGLTALNRMAGSITSSLKQSEVLDQIMRHGADLSGAAAACIAFYDRKTGLFNDWVTHGLSDHFVRNMVFSPGGLADETFTTGAHVLSNDLPGTRHRLSRLARDEGIRSFICLPLTSRESRLGVIYFYRKDCDTFTADELALLQTVAHLAAGVLENARLYARVEAEARTDALTGLHNRRWLDGRLQEEVQRSHRFGKSLSVLMLDIDHFKRINDQYGHPAGDIVLRRLAEVVASQLREVDLATRYGGEEFVVMLPETDDAVAKHGAERIRRTVASTSFALPGGGEINMTVSIGVACYPGSAAGAEELIARADQALYLAKQAGRNRVVLYRDMLTAEIEKDPNRIVELLREGAHNIQPVVTAVAAKAVFYRGHNDVVGQTAGRLAEALDLPVAEREALRLACQLHDIGMAVIPDAVLNKKTALTPAEWQQIRQHPAVAAQFLEQVPALRQLAPIVRHHHERWDGGGYPDGIKGEAIPYLARVLAVADTYGSLISDWLGRKAESPDAALAELRAAAGTQLDPAIAHTLVEVLAPADAATAPH